MSIFDENTEHEDRPEFDDNGEPIIYIEEDIIPDEFASEDDGVIDLDVQDDSFYETVWGGDASSVATLAADDSTTGEEVTDPLQVELEQDTKDTTENDGILEQANEDYNNAVDTLIGILTQALAQGEITEEMNASILDAQGAKTKNEQIIKEICNVQEDNSILKQLADIKSNMVAASVDDILDILTQGGTKPWLYKDSDNNVLVDGQSIPELTVLVNKLNLIATGGDEASEIQLTPEFINLISTSDIKLQAKNITLEGLVTANDNFKILEDGSIVAKNGTFTGKVFIGNNGSVIDDSALSDGIQQGAKDGTLAVQKLEIVNADIKNLKADKADITDLNATNAKIENLTANKADIEYLTANYATIKQLDATNANVSNLQANKANITDLNATNAEVENLKANKADVEYLDTNYATINLLNTNVANINKALIDKASVSDLTATNAVIEDLKASKANVADLTAVSAKVTDLQANKADISVLEANYATIKQLDATNANVGTLQAETANINKALIDKANVSDLNATNANVTNLQATKANVTDLNAANANINTLTGNLAEITTLVNGNLTSDNIQSMVITGDKFTVENGFIKNAMIDSINANKINTGTINTNNVKIQSNDGSMVLQGNLQQFKDKNGKVRIQLGKDAKGNFTFVLYDENGTGQLINEKGIQSSNAIADGLIVDSKVADNANIAGSKLDIDSVVTEINDGSTSIKGTKIYLDEQKQALNVAFNNMTTTVKGNTDTIKTHTTSINTMNGKVTKLISDTTITKQDGTTTSLKDAYNATVDTVNSHSTKIGSLETNLATANNNISSVSSKQAALEQNLNGFKQTVSDTYTTKAEFDGLQVGGTNLLLKTKNFDGVGGANKTGETYRGLTVRGTNSIPNTDTYICEYGFTDFDYNDIFTFSFYAKGNLTNLCAFFYGNSGYVSAYAIQNSVGQKANGSGDGHSDFGKITSDWKRYWVTWQIAGSGNKSIIKRILLRTDGSKVGENIYICGCKFERGNKATEWTPAPQDIDSAITTVDSKFNNYSTTSQMNSAITQKANEITSSVSETYATKASLTTVDNKFANYSTTSAMNSAINQKANEITSSVSQTYATKSSLKATDDKFANYSTTSAMNSAINQKANEITSNVSETYATKTSLNTVDGKFANYSTTTAMNTAINQKADSILSTVSSNYATKTALTNVDNKFANYSTTSAMNSAINQKGDSILSTVSNTYTTKAEFNDLSIGGTNLLPNTKTFKDWGLGGGTLQANGYNGFTVRYKKFTATSGGSNMVDFSYNSILAIEPNTDYTLSFWIKGTGKFFSYIHPSAIIKVVNCDGATWGSDVPSDGGITNTVSNSNSWRRFWITFTSGNNVSGNKSVIVARQYDGLGNSELYICGVKLEKGSKASDWSPAPQDIDTSITAVDNKFVNYSTTSQMNSAINQKANEITSTVSETYATKTALNTVDGKFANYSTTSAMNSAINQKGDSILSTVSDTYTTKADFNGLEVGGTNLLLKTKTSDNLIDGMNKTGDTYRGLTVRGGSIVNANQSIWQYNFGTNFNYGDTFTFSFYAKGNITNLYAYFYGANNDYVRVAKVVNSQGRSSDSSDGNTLFKITNEWQRYWVTWTLVDKGYDKSVDKWMLLRPDGSTAGQVVYVCGCKMEKGNRATEWSPAPQDVDSAISTVDGKFSNYSTTSQMNSAINQKANEITSTVSNTYATKTSLKATDDKFANYSTTTAMNSAINQKGDSILSTVSNTYATKTTVTDLSNNLKNNYSTTTAMNTAINQKSDAILSTVSNTYATKTALNSVDGKFANYSTTSAMNTAINQKSDAILSTVSSNYTTKSDFNNLSIGGTNLVTGTKNFDNGWFYDGFALRNGQYDGTFKGCYISWGGTSGYHDVGKNDCVYLEPNTEYTLSFWARGNGRFWSYLYKPSTVVVASGYNSSGATTTSPDGAIVNTLTNNDNFKRYWITWKTASNLTATKCNIIPCRVASNIGNCSIVICGVKIEKGNKATAWTPAPQDIDSAISAVDNKFASYSTTQQMNTAINQKAESITQSVSSTYATKTSLKSANDNITSLTNRMQSAESKLTKDSLTTTIGSYYTTSTDVNNLVTAKGYATTSQVSQTATDLTAKFKSTGGINLIRNSTAIGGLNGWQGNISYSEADSVGRVTGNRRFFYINNKNTIENYAFSPRFPLKANTTYTLSCWIYRNTTSTGYDIFVLSSNSLPWTNTSTSFDNVYHLHNGSSTSWERVEKTFTTGANDISGYVRIDNNGYTGSGDANVANIHFGSLMLTEGTIAHPWTPHPSECYSGITQIDSEGIKVYHNSIDGNSYTHMSPSGFYLKNKGTDILKVDSNGLYFKGNGDFTGKVTANDGSIGGFTISNGKLVGTGGNGVGMSGNGTDWAFWAGASTGGSAPFHVGHEGNLYATQAYITGTITGSTINAGTINGATINSDSFIGDVLAIDGTISAKSLQVQDIDNAKYPATLDGDIELYVNSSSGNDDNEPDDGVRYKTLQGAIDAIPKFLNGKTVYITMETNSTEDVYIRGIVGGAIRIYMNGKTLYGTLRSYVCSCSISVYGGTRDSTEGATGVIHPNVGLSFGSRAVSVGFEASQYAALYKVKVYAPDKIPSDVSSTDKVCVAAQAGTGSVYCKNVQIVNAVIGFRSNNHGSMHVNSSSGVASKYGFQGATGGIISIANNNQCGGKTSSTNKNGGGQVWYDANGPTFATGNQTTDSGSAPTVSTTKTMTIKSTYGDTYRSSVYNNWKKDGTARQGDYGYGDCTGCWFFGSAFSELKGCTISKVEITITRQSGGSSSPVGLVVRTHNYSSRPSGAPTLSSSSYGTLSLATGKTDKLTITHSDVLNGIKNGTIKGFGIRTTYDSAHYAVCSGSVTVKITYTE